MTRHTIDTCARCGEPESEHHAFEAVTVPDGCQCDLDTWRGVRIPFACSHFETARRGFPPRCKNCEHDRECHEVKK
jgi:hypothetical protein